MFAGRLHSTMNRNLRDMAHPLLTHVFLIGGIAASGKTIFGLELSAQTGYPFFDKDTQTELLVDALLVAKGSHADDRSSPIYVGPFWHLSSITRGLDSNRYGCQAPADDRTRQRTRRRQTGKLGPAS